VLDLDAYLERIGLDGRPSVAQLHRAHLTSIPFENLDPHQGLPVSLEVKVWRALRTRLAVAATLSCVIVALAAQPERAQAGAGDAAATRTYIEANYGLVRVVASRIGPIETELRGVLAMVRSECPAAAAGSPQGTDSEQLSNEVIGTLVESAVRLLVHPASLQFVLIAGALKWSDGGLTHTIHAYVAKLETLATIGVPSLCSDVRVWAASAFHTLPGSTVDFDARFVPNWVSAGELPAALARHETPSERPLIRRTRHLEGEVAELEAREVETWGQIMNALGLLP
jgi:hypothetical protein